MNITATDKDIEELSEEYNCLINLNRDESNHRNKPYLFITGLKGKSRTYNLPKKKEVNKKYIASKIEKLINSNYKNLRNLFSKLDLKGNIYFTSFGFSYDCILKDMKTFNKDTKALKRQLDKLDIEYKTEFSKGRWVYRFKISKSKENLQKIKELVKDNENKEN